MIIVRNSMTNHLRAAMLLGAGAVIVLGSASAARAGAISISGGSAVAPNTWTTETGQSIPTGTAGTIGGTVSAVGPTDNYTFTFGGGGLVAGDTGHGNSIFLNEFWVGPDEATAEAAGHVFCTQAEVSCGNLATVVGAHFTMSLSAGAIPFGFTFGSTNNNVLQNGQTNNDLGAYLAQIGLGTTASTGPGLVAYLGLSDSSYPTDHDFQDLVVRVSTVPEPGALLLVGIGLVGLALYARRRKNLVA